MTRPDLDFAHRRNGTAEARPFSADPGKYGARRRKRQRRGRAGAFTMHTRRRRRWRKPRHRRTIERRRLVFLELAGELTGQHGERAPPDRIFGALLGHGFDFRLAPRDRATRLAVKSRRPSLGVPVRHVGRYQLAVRIEPQHFDAAPISADVNWQRFRMFERDNRRALEHGARNHERGNIGPHRKRGQ